MNQAQRKYLVEKIKEELTKNINQLKESYMKYPSASNYIFKAVMENTLQLQTEENILLAIRKKALAAKEGENWLSEQRMGMDKENSIRLYLNELIVFPEDYYKELIKVKANNKAIDEKISQLQSEFNSLEMRIQLASDKVLQSLVNEVDDMGNLSLINTKLKLLN